MRNQDYSAVAKCSLTLPDKLCFSLGIEHRRRLVEHQYPRVLKKRSGQRQPLALPTGEFNSLVTDDGLIAIG